MAGRVPISAIQKKTDGSIVLRLHVKPGAKVSRMINISEQAINMQIAALPKNGEANEEILKYVSAVLGVRFRQLQLISGHKSREKTVLLSSIDSKPELTIDEVKRKLEHEVEANNK